VDHIGLAVDAGAESDTAEGKARYQRLAVELDRAASDFATRATAIGVPPPTRFMTTVKSYRQRGADLIKLAADRRDSMTEYSTHFEQMNARFKKSLDHAWNIFGRVVARQALLKLTGNLDDLRRRYADFVASETVDSPTFDSLGASEGALASTLSMDRAGFSRAEGEEWYTKSQDDLQAMSNARRTLLRIDRERKEGARKFADDSAMVVRIVEKMAKTETTAAAGTAAAVAKPSTNVATSGAEFQRRVSTTIEPPQDNSNRVLVAWLSVGVLLLVVYISVGTIKAQKAARNQQHLLESKVAERTQQLLELAQLDPLTRLANRRHFFTLLDAALGNAVKENRLVGVFFLDIDNFKNMNDSLGHEFGDQVLQTIARRLTDSTQAFGFAARLGGDEFTVVYESASTIEDIHAAGLRLIKAFQEPMPLEGRELVISVSAGASVFPLHADAAEALLRAADAALYEAKALGRSQLALFTPALLEAATARFTTEQGLRRALDRGEFELVFQPEVNLQTCETELVEALLRWRLPDGRCVAPGEFLAVAEASGLILQINDWVLRRVIEAAARWHYGAWPAVRVAINVSSRQLFDNSFVDQVMALLKEHKLPPRCIEIELTENVLQTGSTTIAALRRLRAHGIDIALDDFGTGFSSLASLEQLPLTRIKLDRSLIASIDTSAKSATIARAIIQLCQGLGLSITAEGIERSEQLDVLVGNPAAIFGQGYLIARPQTPDDLLPVLARLPELTRTLVHASVARLPDAQIAESLPFIAKTVKH